MKRLLTAKSMGEKETDMRKQEQEVMRAEMRKEKAADQGGLVSWSPRKNDLVRPTQPLKDWLPATGKDLASMGVSMEGKQGKVANWAPTISGICSDAPLNPWLPGKALAEASSSSKTPDSTLWTPGSSWIPGKALAEAAPSNYEPGREKTRA